MSIFHIINNRKTRFSHLENLSFFIFIFFNYIFPYFMWSDAHTNYNAIVIFAKISAGLASLFIILSDFLPPSLKKIYGFYWHMIIFYCLPFMTMYIFLISDFSPQLILNVMLAIILCSIMLDWITFSIMIPLASVLAYIGYYLTTGSIYAIASNEDYFIYFYMYIYCLCVCIIFVRNKDNLNKEAIYQLENKVNERTAHLKKALSAKNTFLNNISHEVRTPIHSVTAISEGLLDNWDNINEQEKYNYLKELSLNSNRLYDLVNDLLDLSKLNSGKMTFNYKLTDLNQLVKQTVQECESLYLQKGLNVYTDLSKFLPKCFIDHNRISQVIRNLLYNAIKFTPKGKITITTRCYNNGNSHDILFKIADTGVGIPQNEVSEIFNSFAQSSITKTGAGGTGLGLSICKEIITKHNGMIWAESNYINGGAEFYFIIPQNPDNKSYYSSELYNLIHFSDDEISQFTEFDNKIEDHKITNILIIDDEPGCLNSLELMLYDPHYKIIKSKSGHEGLEILKNNNQNIDLILLDLMMPDIYGINVLLEIKNNYLLKDIPVIIQTGCNDKSEINKAFSLGAEACIKKPYDKKEIIKIIRNAIKK